MEQQVPFGKEKLPKVSGTKGPSWKDKINDKINGLKKGAKGLALELALLIPAREANLENLPPNNPTSRYAPADERERIRQAQEQEEAERRYLESYRAQQGSAGEPPPPDEERPLDDNENA